MTEDEIKKALECCKNQCCSYCPHWCKMGCRYQTISDALDLITEQEKEIEKLKSEIIKQDQAIIERNFELVELEDKLKQDKIDVLTELKEKKSIAVWDIDEMIEELQK